MSDVNHEASQPRKMLSCFRGDLFGPPKIRICVDFNFKSLPRLVHCLRFIALWTDLKFQYSDSLTFLSLSLALAPAVEPPCQQPMAAPGKSCAAAEVWHLGFA